MGLRDYRRKRDFKRTPEPAGSLRRDREKGKLSFVVQKHAARRLHYDFRLELDGVLKSWAVPKGPSLDPGVKRLAVQVEDHPIQYGTFEGVIPRGEYGGGTVMVWDRGWWEPKGDPKEGYAKGSLKFTLHGKKLEGAWALVRMARREGDKADNWLLIKERDASARPGSEDEVVSGETISVASGRDIAAIAEDADRVWSSEHGEVKIKGRRRATMTVEKKRAATALLDPAQIAGAKRAKRAPKISPELATLASNAPSGDQWLNEIKFDGYRMLAHLASGKVALRTRNDLDWTRRFPELARALAQLRVDEALLDGEVVHFDERGVSSFSALQNDLSQKTTKNLAYMAFDLLFLDGWDLTGATTEDRKAALQSLLESTAPPGIRYSDHQIGRGPEFLAAACRAKLEGIVSKRRDAPYRAGRNPTWLKVKCGRREELVVIGYTDPTGARSGFGALLVGYYTPQGELVYAGKVGTGFTQKTLVQLYKKLGAIERRQPTVQLPTGVSSRGVHWVRPELVAEIAFSEWTKDALLRQPSFLGLREDKTAEEAVLDRANGEPRPVGPARGGNAPVGRDGTAVVDGVRITHAHRPVFPEERITKLAVAEYYAAIAERMLPHIARRPLSLLRCPDGLAGKCFFQKHLAAGMPASIKQIPIAEKDEVENFVMIEEKQGLLALVQMGVLEFHPWGSTVDRLDKPDRLIFDLDPDEALDWNRVIAAALAVRNQLESFDLRSFVKTTGGKGLHVVVPIKPTLDWDAAKEFSRLVVVKLASEQPSLYTSSLAKNARRGRLFIDYLRNARGATAVAAYSTRARPGAPVSAPLSWEEVESGVRSDEFSVLTLPRRLASLRRDPWADLLTTKQTISAAARRKLGAV
jgi:bifunctional non-homologous end joining protein LigD